MKNLLKLLPWVARLVAAVILLQTLFFKFTAAEESVYIFTTVGMEPWGRIGSGVVELIASVLLFMPRFTWLGALLGLGTMSGAILFHFTTLGISVQGDGGQLFAYAVLVWASCLFLLLLYRKTAFDFVLGLFPRTKQNHS
ncbi:MAG: DoxX family protein [Cytophagales bacterium]|jgi:uncharacterized membrane protein YphA (DoxX/SURF4 family)|nr:DoxX family protein [Cytophagales bacterium]